MAQLYLALPSDRTRWSKFGTGVVCLVKDKEQKSFFIRFLDIKVHGNELSRAGCMNGG